jgi:hypothetical protein
MLLLLSTVGGLIGGLIKFLTTIINKKSFQQSDSPVWHYYRPVALLGRYFWYGFTLPECKCSESAKRLLHIRNRWLVGNQCVFAHFRKVSLTE